MKVIVATHETQGYRGSDFCWTEDGELVRFGFVCARDANSPNPDGGCGCGRSMAGMKSKRATTTVKVVEWVTKSRRDLVKALRDSLRDAGWIKGQPGDVWAKAVTKEAGDLIDLANQFEVGDVLEIRGDVTQVRPKNANINTPIKT